MGIDIFDPDSWSREMQRQATEARDIAKVDYLRQLARSTGTQERWKGEIADSIHSLASQYEYALDGVASGLEGVRDSIEGLRIDVSEGFEALGALFDWRMQTVIALLEEQQRIQGEILKRVMYPRTTEAEEMKERARRSYYKAIETAVTQPDWRERYLNDALRDFSTAADKNPQDYTLHLDIGRILLLEHNQPAQALRYFDEAARHAHLESEEWEGKAYFYMARNKEVLGNVEEAYTAACKALELESDNLVYAYELARYCVLTNRADECARHLERTLRAQAIGGVVSTEEAKVWWAKINAERDFANARGAINQLFTRLTNEAHQAAESALEKGRKALTTVERAEEMVRECIGEEGRAKGSAQVQAILEGADQAMNEGQYWGYLNIIPLVQPAYAQGYGNAASALDYGRSVLQNRLTSVRGQIQSVQSTTQSLSKNLQNKCGNLILLCFLVVPFGLIGIFWSAMIGSGLIVIPLIVAIECRIYLNSRLSVLQKQETATLESLHTNLKNTETQLKRLGEGLEKVRRGEYL